MTQYAPRTLIIGGTAAYGLDLTPYQPVGDPAILDTPYGPSPPITFLQADADSPPVAFCSRHGAEQLARSAAFVNHRALIWAAKMLGVSAILSWNGTGAIAGHLHVGDLVVPDDFLDFTRSRSATFDRTDLIAATGPAFDADARSAILFAIQTCEVSETSQVFDSGTYVCTEGPRLETVAEIAHYRRAGADLVGMTLSPEVFLAQEVGIVYASLCYITNYATGTPPPALPRVRGGGMVRQFGPIVAHTCLPILLTAAQFSYQ